MYSIPEVPAHTRAAALRLIQPPGQDWPTPASVAAQIDPRTIETPALTLLDRALLELLDTPDGRLIISMSPQEGKSSRVGRDFAVKALIDNPDRRIITGCYGQGLANRNGRAIRNAIINNPQFGLSIAADHGAASEWTIAGRKGGVVSVGRGAGVSGRPCDCLIVDDPLKDREEADSDTIRETCWDWWTDSLSARLAPGAPVVIIMTRWHAQDLAGMLLDRDTHAGWRLLNIPAQCDDPATDPLGRAAGEYMISARGRTTEQWEARKKTVGSRGWTALYQGRPSPPEGGAVKRGLWQRYATPLWATTINADGEPVCHIAGVDEVLISADLTFKGTETSDRVAMSVWARAGVNAYLLDMVCGWMDFADTLRAFTRLARKWPQAVLKLVEDTANGPALMSMLAKRVPGIVPITPRGSKLARIMACVPLIEAGNVHIPEAAIADWVDDFVEELAGFPTGAHDDQVDSTSQALDRLLLRPLTDGTIRVGDDVGWDEYDTRIGY